jgi:hypothetical protein
MQVSIYEEVKKANSKIIKAQERLQEKKHKMLMEEQEHEERKLYKAVN